MGKSNFVVAVITEDGNVKAFGPFSRKQADDVAYEVECDDVSGNSVIEVTRLVEIFTPNDEE